MTAMASLVVVLDANVLYGIEVTDLILTAATLRARRSWPPKTIADILNRLEPKLPVTVSLLRIRFD
jgi:hypothetical protein